MHISWSRRALMLLAALLAFATSFTVSTPTAAYAATCTGVTVVVDFTAVGGTVRTACAPGDPASGLAALTGAGYTYAFVPRFPGFICRINLLPNPCNGAPATAYWSYWHAAHHGTWAYSSSGAGTYNPAPGSVDGWAFGAGTAPHISPP